MALQHTGGPSTAVSGNCIEEAIFLWSTRLRASDGSQHAGGDCSFFVPVGVNQFPFPWLSFVICHLAMSFFNTLRVLWEATTFCYFSCEPDNLLKR